MTAAEFKALLESLRSLPYGGEAVDQYQHAVQSAALAIAAGADDDVVLAAALHDIGRARTVAQRHPDVPHEASGEQFVSELIGERAGWLVGAHVAAKRYLVFSDAEYRDTLSPVSQRLLVQQGEAFTKDEADAFIAQPWADQAVQLRRWDDLAKDPDARLLPLDDLIAVYERHRSARSSAPS
ncbi:MAG: HD family phosphohydrolase [Candidatus Eremiobacteraeota bacterium]|nr:HD family phosphohydrolase [Candidatus Eremiobacteraeota bacterium]